jgi:hypothetical protein
MKRQSATDYLFANPLTLWTGLALKTGEMMMASAQVIGHRTARIASAGAAPSLRDRREFALMGREKLEAATESAQAIATHMFSLNQQVGTLAFKQVMAGATGMMSLAASSTVAQSGKIQARLMSDTISSSTHAASRLADSVARIAQHGLQPIHSRATANARRLAKLKKQESGR